MRYLLSLFALVFLVFSNTTIYGADEAAVTIDLEGTTGQLSDYADRELTIWKLSDDDLTSDIEAIMSEFAGMTNDEITEKYPHGIKNVASDSFGQVTISATIGSYYVREKEHDIGGKVVPFMFAVTNTDDITVRPKKEEPGGVELLKKSSDGTALPGAEFELYRIEKDVRKPVPMRDGRYAADGLPGVLVTDMNGKIVVAGLPAGDYVFHEIKAPEGYEIREADSFFTVEPNKISYIEVINFKEHEGGINFRKVTDDPKPQPIANVKFLVTQKNGEYYDKVYKDGVDYIVTSDAQGYFMVDNLPYGEYYLWEVETPQGYLPLSGPVHFVIDKESMEQMITIENKRMNPGQPLIPDTGDITLFLVTLLGLVIGTIGYMMVKEKHVE